jgi:hypothetical protein
VKGTWIIARDEILGFEVFGEATALGSTSRWGIAIRLAARTTGPGMVHFWMIDGQRNQDEYTMRQTVARIESVLGT